MRRPAWIGPAVALLFGCGNAQAGTFINSQVNPNLRTHPQNFSGVGGDRPPIRVCVDVQANEPMAIQSEPAVRKVIATLNRLRSLGDHSYATNPATDMPASQLDFESVLLHEMLHSQGLAHPNLADESGLPPPLSLGTRSTAGANNIYEQDAGIDGLHGSADDLRGDDVNLHWFRRGVNDPGALPDVIDETTMATTLDFLPSSHRYAANAGRDVLAALGYADAEAVVHQGARVDEVQRHLHHDDVATLRLAQAGIDGIEGTADDYRTTYVYTGRQINPQGVDCEVAIRFDNSAALATTTTSAVQIAPNHIAIWYARMRINPAVNWYFSPGPNTQVSIDADAPVASAPYTVRVGVAKTPGNPIAGYPRGVVEVRDGARGVAGTAYCTVTLAGSPGEVGQCQITPLRAGTRMLVADYLGYAGFDGGSASVSQVLGGTVQWSDVHDTPDPSTQDTPVEFRWMLSAPPGQLVAMAGGTVTVKEAADCASPPSNPAHQCTAAVPANACTIRFATTGTRTLRLCYSGDGVFPAVATDETHEVVAGRTTGTFIVSHLPATSATFEPIAVKVGVGESPSFGGFPAGAVVVRDGPEGDPFTAACTVALLGAPGENGVCTLVPKRAGVKTLSASFAAQGVWAASSTTAAITVGSLAIVRNTPNVVRLRQRVSVAVNLDVAPYLGSPAPTGTITVSDGVDQCQIVLPASECLWRGGTAGVRSLVASWPGDANYSARTSAAASQFVEDNTYPQLISAGRSAYPDSDGASTTTRASVSADGHYVAFASDAAGLVDDDSNGVRDIFVRDLRSGLVRRVSTDAFGGQATGASDTPAISADGRYVSFSSIGANLVPGDTNAARDLFVKDLATGGIVRVTLRADGSQDSTSQEYFGITSSLSADGRYVAFSFGGILTPGDGNGAEQTDVYVKDLKTGAFDLVSSNSDEVQGDFRSMGPSISADGRYVAMSSQAFNFPGSTGTTPQVYVKDRLTRRLVQASSDSNGVPGNRMSGDPALSADGRYVAFVSMASNLTIGAPYNDYDILVRDLQTGAIERQNLNAAGQRYARSATAPAISADGRYVVFTSLPYAPTSRVDVLRKDRQTKQLVQLNVDPAGASAVTGESNNPAISADGRVVAFQSGSANLVAGDGNGAIDSFVRDVQLSTTVRASAVTGAARADAASDEAATSRDGRYVAFSSLAGNLVGGDGDALRDIFVHDRNDAGIVRVSTDAAGVAANGASDSPSISADGLWIAFRSAATNLVAGDTNVRADVFVKQRATGAITRVSTTAAGTQGSADARGPTSISGDGNWVVFGAADGGLAAGDANAMQDIFAKNRATGAIVPVSVDAAGVFGNGDSMQAVIDDAGTRVAFASLATNLAAGDINGVSDVYVKNLSSGAVGRVSVDGAGAQANGASSQPVLSGDGRYVAFASAASNLVVGDTNGNVDIFVKDADAGGVERVNTDAAGQQGTGGDCGTPSLSGDARYVAFVCAQANLVAGDSNGVADVFVKDRQTGTIARLSVNANGVQANAAGTSTAQALSDGGIAVFASAADNLVTADGQRHADVFAQRYSAAGWIATTTVIGAHAPNPTTLGAPYTVSVAVTRSSGTAAIGGTVMVGDGDGFCSAALSGSGATASGQCTLNALRLGVRRLSANYGGDAAYAGSAAVPANHRVIDARVPSAPRIVAASAGNARVTVTFAASDDEGGSPISGYRATCGASNQTGAASPIIVGGLSNGVAVTCTVRATNAAGDGPASAPSASVTPATTPGAPTGVVATRGNAQVGVAFAAPGNNGGSAILDYTVQCGSVARTATTSPIVIGTLTNGSAVSCSVSARNARGRGVSSVLVQATPATVPDAPTGVTAARGNAQVAVSFAAPAGNGGDPIVGYAAHCGAASGSASSSPVVVSGLSNGVAVTCTVVANNGIGGSVPSAPSAGVTPATVPDAPNLTALTEAAGSAQLAFDAPAQNGGSAITGYRGTCTPGPLTATAAASPMPVPGIVEGTTYTCSVQAINDVGTGNASNSLTVTPRAAVDLSVANSNGTAYLQGGQPASYLVDVVNHSTTSIVGARVVNAPAANFGDVSWICSAQGGGVCPPGGSGGIDVLVDLPANATVTFLIDGTVAALPEQPLSSTATVTAPGNVIDTNPANDTATDGPDTVGLFRSGFE